MLDNNPPLLSICCIAYNQEKYIRDAIEGFLIQKTEFPFEIIIHDDASTDGTAEVIREYQYKYPTLINGVFQRENQFSKSINLVIENVVGVARGKYIALCEGDDYWTDPLKLQKQVDFLETHPECAICFHQTLAVYEDNTQEQTPRTKHKGNGIFTYRDLYRNCMIQTCSVVFRNMKLDEYLEKSANLRIGDWPLFTYLAQFGDIGFLDETMSVYRIHNQGLWNSFGEVGALEVQAEALEFFKDSDLFKKSRELFDSLFMFYYKLALLHFQSGEKKKSNQYLLQCFNLLTKSSWKKMRFFNSLFVQLKLPKIYSLRDRLR